MIHVIKESETRDVSLLDLVDKYEMSYEAILDELDKYLSADEVKKFIDHFIKAHDLDNINENKNNIKENSSGYYDENDTWIDFSEDDIDYVWDEAVNYLEGELGTEVEEESFNEAGGKEDDKDAFSWTDSKGDKYKSIIDINDAVKYIKEIADDANGDRDEVSKYFCDWMYEQVTKNAKLLTEEE